MHPILFTLNRNTVFSTLYICLLILLTGATVLLFMKNNLDRKAKFKFLSYKFKPELSKTFKYTALSITFLLIIPIAYFLLSGKQNLQIDSYSIFFTGGFIAGILLTLFFISKYTEIDKLMFLYFICVILISSIFGAKLFSALFDFQTEKHSPPLAFFNNPLAIFTGQVGFVIYGGLIFAVIGGLIYLKIKNNYISEIPDAISPSLFLGIFFGRIGCFLNGCCFGKCVSKPGLLSIPWMSFKETTGTYRFYFDSGFAKCEIVNTQLISSFFALIMFILFLFLYHGRKKLLKGILLPLAFQMYSIFRFIIEFYRGDNPDWIFGMTISQIISIFVFSISTLLILKLKFKNEN